MGRKQATCTALTDPFPSGCSIPSWRQLLRLNAKTEFAHDSLSVFEELQPKYSFAKMTSRRPPGIEIPSRVLPDYSSSALGAKCAIRPGADALSRWRGWLPRLPLPRASAWLGSSTAKTVTFSPSFAPPEALRATGRPATTACAAIAAASFHGRRFLRKV
jgi:hypothetical protein